MLKSRIKKSFRLRSIFDDNDVDISDGSYTNFVDDDDDDDDNNVVDDDDDDTNDDD